jgi:predicted cupin superfamily sugar epimerase
MNTWSKEEVIKRLGLELLPVEGGFFRQSYRSAALLPDGTPAATAIFFLMGAPHDFSAMHRLDSDELFHFYLGDPVESLLLHPDGGVERVVLGQDIFGGECLQMLCPAGVWQGHRVMPGGSWSLIGSTMAPGFTGSGFVTGRREDLSALYPSAADLIGELTRRDAPLTMPEGY